MSMKTKEEIKAQKREWYLQNREKVLCRMNFYYSFDENKQRRSENFQRWKRNNDTTHIIAESVKSMAVLSQTPFKVLSCDFSNGDSWTTISIIPPAISNFGAKVKLTEKIYSGTLAPRAMEEFTTNPIGAKVKLTGKIYPGSIKRMSKKDGTPYYTCSLEFLTQYGDGKPYPQWIDIKTYFNLCGNCFNNQIISVSGELRSIKKTYYTEKKQPVEIKQFFIFAESIKSETWKNEIDRMFEKAVKELERGLV